MRSLPRHAARRLVGGCLALPLALSITACDQPSMEDQDKFETFEAASGWPNDQAARMPVTGTIPHDADLTPTPATLPYPLTHDLLRRGQQRFDIYCSPCHSRLGDGQGMVVQRGFPQPPTFHSERLRQAPLRHFYDVISDGYGVMYSYRDRVPADDRWAIAAYIRALQLARHAQLKDVPIAFRQALARDNAPEPEVAP